MVSRFLTLTDVTEILNVSMPQAYALVHNGDLRAMQIGGRGQWRISQDDLEEYIQRMYSETERRIRRGEREGSTPDKAAAER
ncbi:helix-turn-helix domain-containing protein [Cellulomonas alba]|uniref:Helix-turn-helix domain-containing protein n=1 Tax=Cellulomonas alba TaxID=3053467 RepID=A0ABT7SEK8_9CELL|nr:helix-turn-helix domain-containing protein [Cellulomonas alba]MDM7853979.1 helix-turn-helix domain-containing protein [Cellulomonas alba]